MSTVGLALSQARYVNKSFWRNPMRASSTFALALMFLVIFTALLGNGVEHVGGVWIKESTYYVAAMATFAVIQACYTNIAASVSVQRDLGILKRIDGTPLPKGSFTGSRVAHSILVAVILVAITVAFGRVAYGAAVADRRRSSPFSRHAHRRGGGVLRPGAGDHRRHPQRRFGHADQMFWWSACGASPASSLPSATSLGSHARHSGAGRRLRDWIRG